MGLGIVEIEFIVHEHAFRPITGEILAIGRQGIGATRKQILDILRRYEVPILTDGFEANHLDRHHTGADSVSDVSFFRSFSDATYLTADISPYEGADFIFDICGEVPEELKGRFDFILDGGSMDNVFDPFRMLQNMSSMLKPGGRMFINAWSNSFPSAYMKITPDWLMDYFAVNGFEDCKLYVSRHASTGSPFDIGGYVDLYHYDPYVMTAQGASYQPACIKFQGLSSIYCLAEKGEASTANRTAVQQHYRGKDHREPYNTAARRFRESPRPVFARPGFDVPANAEAMSDYATIRAVARHGTPTRVDHEAMTTRKLDHIVTVLNQMNGAVGQPRSALPAGIPPEVVHWMERHFMATHQKQEVISSQVYEATLLLKQGRSVRTTLGGMARRLGFRSSR